MNLPLYEIQGPGDLIPFRRLQGERPGVIFAIVCTQ